MGFYILTWAGNILPAILLPSLQEMVDPACVRLANSKQVGAETALPPATLQAMSFSGSPTSEAEEVEWRVKLLSTEALVGSIGGCTFQMATTFQGKPVRMNFLVPHRVLQQAGAQA